MTVYAIRMRRWTRVEYDRLIAAGTFHPDERLELLGGELVVREPQALTRRCTTASPASRGTLDDRYIVEWADRLGLVAVWEQVRRQAG